MTWTHFKDDTCVSESVTGEGYYKISPVKSDGHTLVWILYRSFTPFETLLDHASIEECKSLVGQHELMKKLES
jgi:hypothetical protein